MKSSLTRKELYDLVWVEPRKTLAPKLGVSDVWITKTCRKAGVPVPDRGYWAKKKAGKKTIKAALPPRFPGATDSIELGTHRNRSWPGNSLDTPIPPPPTFDEEIESVKERITKMVGKVTLPTLTTHTHPIIQALLDQDAERIRERDEKGYSWLNPLYESRIEKRRLRVFNAMFLALQRQGCKPYMSTSKYDREKHDATIQVGEQSLSIRILITTKTSRSKSQPKKLDRLSLTVSSWNGKDSEELSWEDNENSKVENQLTSIVNDILLFSETLYRQKA